MLAGARARARARSPTVYVHAAGKKRVPKGIHKTEHGNNNSNHLCIPNVRTLRDSPLGFLPLQTMLCILRMSHGSVIPRLGSSIPLTCYLFCLCRSRMLALVHVVKNNSYYFSTKETMKNSFLSN